LSFSQIILRRSIKDDKLEEACSVYGEMRNAYKILIAKPEGKAAVDGRITLKRMGVADWIHVAQEGTRGALS
jgi:hypothetical protein